MVSERRRLSLKAWTRGAKSVLPHSWCWRESRRTGRADYSKAIDARLAKEQGGTGQSRLPRFGCCIGVASLSDEGVVGSSERQDSSTEQFHAGAPVHLPAERLQSIDVAFDRPITPAFGDGSFDGAEILAELPDKTVAGRGSPRRVPASSIAAGSSPCRTARSRGSSRPGTASS
jgi:hypothetical protein